MAVELIYVDNFAVTNSHDFFFDNNIWFTLFCPLGNINLKKQNQYSSLLQDIMNLKRPIFLNSLVVSEFSNAWLRLEFHDWQKKAGNETKINFKRDFTDTADYRKAARDIQAALKQIQKICQKGNDDFNALDLDSILSDLPKRDFNDSYYLHLAERKKWIIVSDDSDIFIDDMRTAKVVTANNKAK